MREKKALLILISGVAVLGIVFGVAGTGKNVLLQPEQEAYPAGPTDIHAVFKNVLPGQYHMGSRYILEKYRNGSWELVTKDERGAFFEDDSFSPAHGMKITFDLTKYCDGLTAGKYRIKMTMYNTKEMPEDLIVYIQVVPTI